VLFLIRFQVTRLKVHPLVIAIIASMSSQLTFSDVACTMCGCVCDDLNVIVENGTVASFSPPCPLAEPWLLGQTAECSPPLVNGSPVTLGAAIEEAAAILGAAKAPLIYGLSNSSTPGQRAAVRLADALGANIDTTASTCHAPSIIALQNVGESTCTLGEIRNRSDLVIYWGSNPLESHPRHIDKYVNSPGMFLPEGRNGRHLIVVDIEETATAKLADTFIKIEPGRDFELIWALRGLLHDNAIPGDAIAGIAGVAGPEIRKLAERLKACQYGAVFFGLGITKHDSPHVNVEALLRLVTDLNANTRFVARRMRVPGDVAGADTVLCWQTGFPFSVNLARGYPRYNPGEYTANMLLERGEVDAVLLVGSEGVGKLSPAAQSTLKHLPTIVLDHPNTDHDLSPNVAFTTAVYGIHRRGTAYRMDETPIPLRTVLASDLPADHEILNAVMAKLRSKIM